MTLSVSSAPVTVQLKDFIDFSKPGVSRQTLVNQGSDRFSVVRLTAGTTLPKHSAPRNVSVTVLEGRGILTLAGQDILLEPGVFVYIPANSLHSLQALENLAFLHT